MSFICSCVLEAKGSRMGTEYGCLEDMMRLPRVNDLEFPSSNMSIACRFEHREQERIY